MTYSELMQLLEPVGLPIIPPGVTTKALPAIAVEPVGMGTEAGFAFLWEECEIKVLVPLAENNAKQFFECHDYTVDVWRQLFGTAVQVSDDGPLFGQSDTDPMALYFNLSVRFPGPDLCGTPIPAPPGANITDAAENPLTDTDLTPLTDEFGQPLPED